MDRIFLRITNNKYCKVLFHGNTSEIFNKFDQTIGIAFKENGLYRISSFVDKTNCCVNNFEELGIKKIG